MFCKLKIKILLNDFDHGIVHHQMLPAHKTKIFIENGYRTQSPNKHQKHQTIQLPLHVISAITLFLRIITIFTFWTTHLFADLNFFENNTRNSYKNHPTTTKSTHTFRGGLKWMFFCTLFSIELLLSLFYFIFFSFHCDSRV